jgi:hypothetical protein
MLRRWDIVGVPGDMWPWDESASDFYAIIVSSKWAREKAGIFWLCPIREGLDRVSGEGSIPIRQISRAESEHKSWISSFLSRRDVLPARTSDCKRIVYEKPIARLDLLITAGRHELLPIDFGAVDRTTQILLQKELRKFVGI